MKTKALMVFTVSYAGIRIKVRLLATTRDAHREYVASNKQRAKGKQIHAFTQSTAAVNAKHIATIVLPSNGRLEELIPHEVFHALIDKWGVVSKDRDESFATALGMLTARITRKIERKYHVE